MTTSKPTTTSSTSRHNSVTPANQILRAGNGKGLLKFCNELAIVLVQRSGIENDPQTIRAKVTSTVSETLKCSAEQAECLIEIALEMIHQKTHGTYQRDPLELSFLMAKASGIVGDPAAN